MRMKGFLSIVAITAVCGRAQAFPIPLFSGRREHGEPAAGYSHSGGPHNLIYPKPQGPAPWNPATFEAPADNDVLHSTSGESIFRKIGRLWSWSRPTYPTTPSQAQAHVPGWQDAKAWAGDAAGKVSSSQTWQSLHLPGSFHAHQAEEAAQERGRQGGWWGLGVTEPPQTMGWFPNAVQHAKSETVGAYKKKSVSWWQRLFSFNRSPKSVSSSASPTLKEKLISSKEQAQKTWWGKQHQAEDAVHHWWQQAQDAGGSKDAPWYSWPSLSRPPSSRSTSTGAWQSPWSHVSSSSPSHSGSSASWWSLPSTKNSHSSLRASSRPTWWTSSALSPLVWCRTGTSWLSALTYTSRLGLWVLGKTLTNGGDIAMFLYDVIGCLVLWQMGRTALFGPPVSLAVLGKVTAVLQKAWAALAGTPQAGEAMIWGRIPAQRMSQARLAFACLTIAPIAFIVTCFVAFPLLLFTFIARNAIPAGIGLAVATTLHAMRHPPFNWVINSTAVSAVLLSYRALAALAMWSAASNLLGYAWAHYKLIRASIKGEVPPGTEAVQRLSGLPVPMAVLQQQAAQLQGAPPAALTANVSPLSWLDQVLLNLGAAATTVEPALDRKLAYPQAVQQQQQQGQGAGQPAGQQQQSQPVQKGFWESLVDTVLAPAQTSSTQSAPATTSSVRGDQWDGQSNQQSQQPPREALQQQQQQVPSEQQSQSFAGPQTSSVSRASQGQGASQSTGASTSESGEAQQGAGSNLKRQSTGNTGSVDEDTESDAQDVSAARGGPSMTVKVGTKTADRTWTYHEPTEAVPWWADAGTKSGGPSDEGGGVPSAVLQAPVAPTSRSAVVGVAKPTTDEDFREMSDKDVGAEDAADEYLSSYSTPKSASGGGGSGGKVHKSRRGASTSLNSAAHQPQVKSQDASHIKQAGFLHKREGVDTGH